MCKTRSRIGMSVISHLAIQYTSFRKRKCQLSNYTLFIRQARPSTRPRTAPFAVCFKARTNTEKVLEDFVATTDANACAVTAHHKPRWGLFDGEAGVLIPV